jgi:hypothetical protein
MKALIALLIAAMVSLSLAGISGAVTVQISSSADISGASQDASGNYYVTEGGTFDVEIEVTNQDESQSATSVEATLSLPAGLSTTESLTKTLGSIAAGDTAETSWEVAGDVAGNYLGQVEITSQGTNTNQDEATTGILVKAPATIVGGVSCSATDSKVVKSDFDVTVTVQNLGDLEATGISIDLSSDPSDISISNPETISSIDGGESGSATYSSLSTDQSTGYTFTATVTSDNAGSDSAECTADTVSKLPNGYICSASSGCSSGCCYSSLCRASSYCEDGDGGDGGGTGPGGGGLLPGEKNATRRPELVPGVGLRNNTRLQAAIQKVLGLANMSEQARQNMLRLSESISSQLQMTRNFRSANATSTMETRLAYQGTRRARNFMLFDSIPKEFAQHADNITVTASGASVEIVEPDPGYLLTYPQLDPSQEVVITYSVDETVDEDVIDSFSAEVYAEALEEAPLIACTGGTTRCSLNDLQVCRDGEWVIQETCWYGCSGGACSPGPLGGIEDYTMWFIIALVAVAAVIALVLITRRKKPPSYRRPEPRKAEPLTPGQQPYRPGAYQTDSPYDRLRDSGYRFTREE